MATHKRDCKVDAVTEHTQSYEEAFKLTVRVSDGERIEVGKCALLEQDTTTSGSQFFISEGRRKQARGHNGAL